METEEALKSGQLYAPSQGFLKKTWNKRFYALYKSSKHGIQRLEVFDTEDNFYRQSPSKIIPLTDCIKVIPAPQKQQANVFEVRKKNHAYLFSAETFQEMTEWVSAVQDAAFEPSRSSSGMALGSILPESSSSAIAELKQEENMIYSSVDAPEVYQVKIMESEASIRCNLHGEYRLLVTPVNISLAEEGSQGQLGRILYAWPYRHIRRYGCSKEVFSLEAGRKCVSGEGLFCFESKDGMLIFQSVAGHVSTLKASQNEMDLQASPSPKFDQSTSFFGGGRQSFPYVENSVRLSPAFARHVDNLDNAKNVPKDSSSSDYELISGSSFLAMPLSRANSFSTPIQDISKQPGTKPLPPVSKPPRKSKNIKIEDSEACSRGSSEERSAAALPVSPTYEDPFVLDVGARKSPQPQTQPDVLYDEPQELTDAWKLYGRDVDETEGERAKQQSPPEPLYAVLEEDAVMKEQKVAQIASKIGKVLVLPKEEPGQKLLDNSVVKQKASLETDNYDHLGVKKPNSLRFASLNPENQHVYGKLVSPRQTSVTPIVGKQPVSENEYSNVGKTQYAVLSLSHNSKDSGIVATNPASSSSVGNYENIAFSMGQNPDTSVPLVSLTEAKQDFTPAHFVHNDVEYAQVQKRTMK